MSGVSLFSFSCRCERSILGSGGNASPVKLDAHMALFAFGGQEHIQFIEHGSPGATQKEPRNTKDGSRRVTAMEQGARIGMFQQNQGFSQLLCKNINDELGWQ